MGCQTAYKPTFCDIVNTDVLACKPTDVAEMPFDLPMIRAIGYRCISGDDWREAKKRIRRGLEIDNIAFPLLEQD